MKDSPLDSVQHHRERLRLRIDAAAKAVAEALQAAADLFVAVLPLEPCGAPSREVETSPIPEMMDTQQAAEYLAVKASTLGVWRCTRRHSLPFVKVGRNVRYRKSDLDKFLQRRTKGGEDEDDYR